MKKNRVQSVVCLLLFIIGIIFPTSQSEAQEISLPAPNKEAVKTTLMQALQDRHSVRSYSDKAISNQTLSNLLWAAFGTNRADGRRTAPSAINAQDIEIYVNMKDGVYHYVATENKLVKVSSQDMRPLIIGRNQFAMKAPITLLLITDQSHFARAKDVGLTLGTLDAGYVSQNICLYCAADGLGTVPCAPRIDAVAVQKMLGLSADCIPILSQPVGYPMEKNISK